MSHWKILPAAAFEAHRELWDSLNRRNADHPLLDSGFVEGLLRDFGSKGTRLAVSLDRDRPGMALVERKSLGSWQTFQPSQAPLGLIMMGDAPALGQVDPCSGVSLGMSWLSRCCSRILISLRCRIRPGRRSPSASTIFRLLA